ncbi:MAG: iron-containing redox enzyme family protein [Acidimicrobiales bacterium]
MTTLLPRPGSDLHPTALRPVALPTPRGPRSEHLLAHLVRPVHPLAPLPDAVDDPLTGEDSALALYLCYELHYRGLPGVDDAWEWEPTLLAERRRLERDFEEALIDLMGLPPVGLGPAAVRAELLAMAAPGDAPSLSATVERTGTLAQVRELAVHRSAYQLKEADAHTWAIPRITGRAKAAMVAIQSDEYGDGVPADVHATMFADTMDELGLDHRYGALLDSVPAVTLTTCNLISLFGLHRRWRGALVGHLALFEMCSVGPMGCYAAALRRLGLGDRATRFYDEHVIADAEHRHIALDDMVVPLVEDEPELGGEVLYGARALGALEGRFAAHVLAAWERGESSLRCS